MTKTSKISRILSVGAFTIGAVLTTGALTEVNAQSSRDPFAKPGYARTRPVNQPGTVRLGKDGKPVRVDNPGAVPAVEQRIDYYKRLRASAAENGAPLPKVTSVLTLDELTVKGILHTPRGYAAMVEATPIKLSYTIYPGEKFFDGQLVAVEENHLVFRRVTKTGKDKFVSTVENKPLRKMSDRAELQSTASQPAQPAASGPLTTVPASFVSPVDEMNNKPATSESSPKPAKKITKARSNK